jgi:Tol biopolymer transport system component/S1-C subfamily serine protease
MFTKKDIPLLTALAVLGAVAIGMIIVGTRQDRERTAAVTTAPTAAAPTPNPTAAQTPTWTAKPPPTSSPHPTATLTPLPSAAPTVSPTAQPFFGPITLGTAFSDGHIVDPRNTFPDHTQQVYAAWSYQHLVDGTPYRLRWALDGNLWSEELLHWDANLRGSSGQAYVTELHEYDADGLPPGHYRLETFIGQRQAQVGTFVILASTPVPPTPTSTPPPSTRDATRQAARSLVQLWVPSDRTFVADRGGSGSIVEGTQGLILTNWHVVGDWLGKTLNEGGFVRVYVTADPDAPPILSYWAQVLLDSSDPELDLAVLRITHSASGNQPVYPPFNLPTIPLSDSDRVRRGDDVILLGFPDFAEGGLSWTEGVVATRDAGWIKSDAGISHGHSGGMMLNDQGALIGIPTEYEPTSVGGVLAKARPVNLARPLIQRATTGVPLVPTAIPTRDDSQSGQQLMVLVAERLNLRDSPGLEEQIVADMPRGTIVQVLQGPQWDGEIPWYRVQVQGRTLVGWASGRYLSRLDVATRPIWFHSNRGGSMDIYYIQPDGTGLTRFTSDPSDEGDVSVSPDARWIVYSSDRDGNSHLYKTESSTFWPIQLTQGSADHIHPAWSPDGSRIAFVSDRDGDWEIYILSADGTGLRQVTFNDLWDSYPAWSPDGSQLVFTSRQGNNYDLYLVNLSTGELRRLTNNPYTDAHPAWRPGSNEIAYTTVTYEGGILRQEIALLNVHNPSYIRYITSSRPGNGRNAFPAWSSDGQWIVYTSEQNDSRGLYLTPVDADLVHSLTLVPSTSDGAPAWSQ